MLYSVGTGAQAPHVSRVLGNPGCGVNTLRFCSKSHGCLFPGLSISKPEPLGTLYQMSVPSLPSVSAAAPGVCSASYMAVPLSLTWLGNTVGIWSLELRSQRGRALAVAQLSHLESQAAALREVWLVEF